MAYQSNHTTKIYIFFCRYNKTNKNLSLFLSLKNIKKDSIPLPISARPLWISGNTLNVMSLIGAIMLIGIVVKNGIVLIDYISLNRERGMGIREAVVTGGHSRLRPVIMTTLTTILGMVPMAIGTGQGSEMWRPMGTAVIGGLTVSTILTLILIPVLYCVFASVGVKRKRKKHHERLLQGVKINSNN